MTIDLNKFKDIFISEVEDHLQKLNENLLKLEKNPTNHEIMDELMRSSHTIKGSSATMGFAHTAFLTHVLEDVFDYARNDLLKITPKIINEIFSAIDGLEKSIESIKNSGQETDNQIISEKIKKITGVQTEGIGKSLRDEKGSPTGKKIKKKKTEQIESVEPKKISEEHLEGEISHIKVPVKRIDSLMDLMEELLIDKMKLENLADKNPELEAINDHLNQLVSNIQYQVMEMRMVPLEQVFLRYPRMVRDLSQKYKKKITLDISGSDLELDRTIVDKLGDPITHLLRNAIDHGITAEGKIKLESWREREYAMIKVEDDGQGINWEKVVEAAVRKNIIGRQESEKYHSYIQEFKKRLTDFAQKNKTGIIGKEQLLMSSAVTNLFFQSRLSTNEEVTETSGRGVGISIVKNFSEKSNGRLIIESPIFSKNVGKEKIFGGTRFTLELPFTLAIIKTLLVSVKNQTFAIPFSVIERSVAINKEDVKSMADQDVAVIDERNVPLIRLKNIFGFKEEEKTAEETKDKKSIVVLIRRGNDIAGVVVDKLLREQEIIVKPLPTILRQTKGFSGSTILGDGKTVLILDVATLLEDTRKLLRV